MAAYRPSVEIRIEEPCSESWEAMDGDSRVRHCDACDRDVLNLAAMTPASIETMLAKDGPRPCMRIVTFEDGTLMTAQVAPRAGLLARITAAVSTLAMVPALAAQAVQSSTQSATLRGKVQDMNFGAIANATVQLRHGAVLVTTKTDAQGSFVVSVPPGNYDMVTSLPGMVDVSQQVGLDAGDRALAMPVTLTPGPHMTTVTMGGPGRMPTPKPAMPKPTPVSLAAPKPR